MTYFQTLFKEKEKNTGGTTLSFKVLPISMTPEHKNLHPQYFCTSNHKNIRMRGFYKKQKKITSYTSGNFQGER